MGSVLVVITPETGLSAAEFAAMWDAESAAQAVGRASVEAASSGEFGPEVLEWVAIPLAVNLASNVIYDLVKSLVGRVRRKRSVTTELEVVQGQTERGAQVLVVRVRQES